ncbi:MAG TPA: hypothetical protein VGB92_08690 [Longimicrobium sp.]
MRRVADLFDELARVTPVLSAARTEHLSDHGELLPHVLMGDIRRLLAQAAEGASEATLRSPLNLLDCFMTEGDEEVQNVIAVSFLEYLASDPANVGERHLREWLGPALRAELTAMEAWVPDPSACEKFRERYGHS